MAIRVIKYGSELDQWFSTTNTQTNTVRLSEILGTFFGKHSFLKGNGGETDLREEGGSWER